MADLVSHREAGVETRRPCGQRQAGRPSEQGSELARVTDFYAAVLRPPSVEGMLADRDDLLFRESALPHQVLPTTAQTRCSETSACPTSLAGARTASRDRAGPQARLASKR